MYFPYLRSKQFELIALREFAVKYPHTSHVTPIIEPVKSTFSSLSKAVEALFKWELPFALILNPQEGDFRRDSKNILAEVPQLSLPEKSGQWIPAFLYSPTQEDTILSYIQKENLKHVMLVFKDGMEVNDKMLQFLSNPDILYIVNGDPDSRVVMRKLRNLTDKKIIRLDQWNIFSSPSCAQYILSEVLKHEDIAISIQDKVIYNAEVQEGALAWKKLKAEVQEEKRYFSNLDSFNWEIYIKSNAQIKKDTYLYRARIIPNKRKKLKAKDMGCPPKELATAGRANPIGIPYLYLYLCHEIETTFYEVRAVYLDKISVGKFKVLRDLNIVDFNNKFNLFYTYTNSESNVSLSDIVKRKILFDQISADLSKPLRRFDTEIEYVPTQLICEYCKLNGADGIRFQSSLHQGGNNVVLFHDTDVQCVSVSNKEIKNVTIEGK